MNKKDKSRIRCSCFFYMGILVLFGTGFLMAETLAAESTHPESFYGRRIERIEIRGNARSLDATVLRIAELEEGRILQKGSIERAALKLEKSSLFAEVDIRVNSDAGEDRAVKIVISLEEKWTLIPVPFFASDGESFMGGLVVVEANLLGTGTQVVAGGMAGNSGLYGFTALVLPSFLGSPWRLSSSLSGGETESEIRTPDNREALTFASRSAGGSFGLAYRITNSITAGFKTTLEQHEIRDTQGFEGNMGESIIGLSLLFNYDGTVPYGSLRKGVMFLSEAAYLFGYPGPSLDAQLLYNIPSFAEGRIRLFALGG
ncbi:MAG: POTRA domain-containing protein [Spirochaetaceae bacterium]